MFDLSKQKNRIAAQPIRYEIKVSAATYVSDYTAFAFVSTSRLVSISSDGQRDFDFL